MAVISLEDTGIGISPEDVSLIFNQFYQADNAPINGSGIGLSLSKKIVDLHHGSIEVSSQKWKGTTFKIRMKLGDDHLDVSEKVSEKDERRGIAKDIELYKTDLEPSLAATPKCGLSEPKEISVLVIEDNQDLLNYLQDQLSDYYEVYTAANGNDALSQAYEKIPDIIVSDVVLPGYSGKEITRVIKSDFRVSHIPVILLTAQSSSDQQVSGFDAMADQYITKPFNMDFLLASMNSLLSNRKILKKHFSGDLPPLEKGRNIKTLDKKFLADPSAIIEQNLSDEKFGIEDICKLIGISRMQLYRKVKALLDCNISDYILNRRLNRHKYYLVPKT